MKAASDICSEIFFLLCPKPLSSLYSNLSVDDLMNCESIFSSNNASSSSSQPVTQFQKFRSKPRHTSSSCSTRLTSSSISALLRRHAQPNSSTSEDLPAFFCDSPISLKPYCGIETSFIVHSYSRCTQSIGDQESVSTLSAIDLTDLLYHTLKENSRPSTLDLYQYPLRLENQVFHHLVKIWDITSFL